MNSFPVSAAAASMNLIRRPLRDLLRQLPSLPVTASGEPDYAEANPDLLVSLAESAELVLQIVHGGFSAIGLFRAAGRSRSRTARSARNTRQRWADYSLNWAKCWRTFMACRSNADAAPQTT